MLHNKLSKMIGLLHMCVQTEDELEETQLVRGGGGVTGGTENRSSVLMSSQLSHVPEGIQLLSW